MLLINASNLYVGGGVQVGVSVIEELTLLDIDFICAVSPACYEQLSPQARLSCTIIDRTPSGLLNFSSRRQLDAIVSLHNVTDVFTIFGPSYWNPKVDHHLVGFALPWLIYDTSSIFSQLSLKEKMKKLLLRFLQPYFFKKNATQLVVETDDVNLRIQKLLGFSAERVYTVSNTISAIFCDSAHYEHRILDKLPAKKDDIWLLTISHDYPHKNLHVIEELLSLLPEKFKFVLTVDDDFKKNIDEKYSDRVFTLGKISSAECPPLYEVCDALFLPTLLECFSASYVEAMYMQKPVFTSDRGFAKTVCKNAAFYFDPLDTHDIAEKLIHTFENPDSIILNVKAGKLLVSGIPSAQERAKKYLSIIYDNDQNE